MSLLYKSRTNPMLGYPADARLLIINADDLGMCHAINAAIFRTFQAGVVRSTSLMVPCPWALHAMHWLQENPDISFAVHLTVICEMVNYGWGPLTSKEKVPTLINESGYFFSLKRMAEFLAGAKLDELEVEFRAQIERVLAAGLKPSHLDWHCLNNGGRDDIFDMTLGLAREYGLALRVSGQSWARKLQALGLPTNDHDLLDSFSLDPVDKAARYEQMLRELPVGLSEWAVHPGLDNAELLTIEPDGKRVRQTDFEFFISPAAKHIVNKEGIILVDYRMLQAVWNATQ